LIHPEQIKKNLTQIGLQMPEFMMFLCSVCNG